MFDNVYGWLTHSAQCKVVGLWTRYTSSMCRKILETKTHTLSKLKVAPRKVAVGY
jgi:hypothetical protein